MRPVHLINIINDIHFIPFYETDSAMPMAMPLACAVLSIYRLDSACFYITSTPE